MATVIRFARHGTKKKPYYRIVVQDHRAARDGKFIEHIGGYDPRKGPEVLTVARDRLLYWLGTGAKMSASVSNRIGKRLVEWTAGGPESLPTPPKAPAKKSTKASTKEA